MSSTNAHYTFGTGGTSRPRRGKSSSTGSTGPHATAPSWKESLTFRQTKDLEALRKYASPAPKTQHRHHGEHHHRGSVISRTTTSHQASTRRGDQQQDGGVDHRVLEGRPERVLHLPPKLDDLVPLTDEGQQKVRPLQGKAVHTFGNNLSTGEMRLFCRYAERLRDKSEERLVHRHGSYYKATEGWAKRHGLSEDRFRKINSPLPNVEALRSVCRTERAARAQTALASYRTLPEVSSKADERGEGKEEPRPCCHHHHHHRRRHHHHEGGTTESINTGELRELPSMHS